MICKASCLVLHLVLYKKKIWKWKRFDSIRIRLNWFLILNKTIFALPSIWSRLDSIPVRLQVQKCDNFVLSLNFESNIVNVCRKLIEWRTFTCCFLKWFLQSFELIYRTKQQLFEMLSRIALTWLNTCIMIRLAETREQ